jgi:hypothetical protein
MKNSETILATIFLLGVLAIVSVFMWQFTTAMAEMFSDINYTQDQF